MEKAQNIFYESQLDNISTVQQMLDFIFDTYIDSAYLENYLKEHGYITKADIKEIANE